MSPSISADNNNNKPEIAQGVQEIKIPLNEIRTKSSKWPKSKKEFIISQLEHKYVQL